jgi:hypothetical protein
VCECVCVCGVGVVAFTAYTQPGALTGRSACELRYL